MRHLIIKSIVLIRCSVLIDKSTTRCSVLIHYPLQCAEGTVHEPLAKQAEAAARDEFLATERTSTPLAARVPDSTFASLRVCLIAPLPDCTFASLPHLSAHVPEYVCVSVPVPDCACLSVPVPECT